MKSSAFYAVIGIGLILVIGIMWFGVHSSNSRHSSESSGSVSKTALTTPSLPASLKDLSIYTNGKYGFSVFYPTRDTVKTSGSSIIEIEDPAAEDRLNIRVSTTSAAVAACDISASGETILPATLVNGVTWKTFQNAQETQYRTVHDGACFTLDQVETAGNTNFSHITQSFSFAHS